MARRDAALLCSAEAFPARRDEALRGALGVGGGWAWGALSWSGRGYFSPGPALLASVVLCLARRCFDLL